MKTSSSAHILHTADAVLSRREFPTWLLLAFAAGSVNAAAFVICERFITHMTGIVTMVGIDAGLWWLMTEYILVLAAFIVGAMASVIPLQGRALRGKPPRHAAPLWTVSAILLGVAVAGQFGVFGPLGNTIEESRDFAFLAIVAFSMGLLNASVGSTTAVAVRTTHMTGPATDFGVLLATAGFALGDERRRTLALALLRGGKIAAFACGAAMMIPVARTLGFAAFAVPALLVVAATVRSYLPHLSSSPILVASPQAERS
ncbi:MAG: YoaK family protein [Kofleriaceae bacterium]|nr:YoaK family protein [Kofleriaceae bacterium]